MKGKGLVHGNLLLFSYKLHTRHSIALPSTFKSVDKIKIIFSRPFSILLPKLIAVFGITKAEQISSNDIRELYRLVFPFYTKISVKRLY